MADKLAGTFSGTMAVQEKHQFDVASLQAYMQENVDGFSGELEVSQFKGGQSNPTYNSRLVASTTYCDASHRVNCSPQPMRSIASTASLPRWRRPMCLSPKPTACVKTIP